MFATMNFDVSLSITDLMGLRYVVFLTFKRQHIPYIGHQKTISKTRCCRGEKTPRETDTAEQFRLMSL